MSPSIRKEKNGCSITEEDVRRLERKKRGYGSFPKPIFHKNAKVNKRSLPILECSECGKKQYAKSYRVKKFELQEV